MTTQKTISIKSTGQLRQFLLDSMIELKHGKMDAVTANTLQKMAAQINESMYAELKAMALLRDMSQDVTPLGARMLTDTKTIDNNES